MFIGLTGGMGCGKSAALNFFSQCKYITIDADTICHTLYNNSDSDIFRKLYARWGDEIILKNGSINRKNIGKIIFKNNKERKWLNAILHPAIINEGLKIKNDSKGINTIFDVPLLYEVGWEKYFDKIVVVWCSEKIRLERLKKRKMTKNKIKQIGKIQFSPELKLEKADYAIINNSNLNHLKEQCQIVANKLKELK